MNDAADYITYIKSILISQLPIGEWKIIREEFQGQSGLYRYRLTLDNGDLLEMFERFTVKFGQVDVSKYSFQWQGNNGVLRKRWDNAPHHPELPTHPAHVHDGADDLVLPHFPVSTVDVLKIITSD